MFANQNWFINLANKSFKYYKEHNPLGIRRNGDYFEIYVPSKNEWTTWKRIPYPILYNNTFNPNIGEYSKIKTAQVYQVLDGNQIYVARGSSWGAGCFANPISFKDYNYFCVTIDKTTGCSSSQYMEILANVSNTGFDNESGKNAMELYIQSNYSSSITIRKSISSLNGDYYIGFSDWSQGSEKMWISAIWLE